MMTIGVFMALFSAGLAVYFAVKYGFVRFHLEVMALLTATVLFQALALPASGGLETGLRGLAALSLITVFVMSCDKALHAWIHYCHAREAARQANGAPVGHPAE